MSDAEIKGIREYIWQKYIDGVHPDREIDEHGALAALEKWHEEHPVSVDGETYYLGILYFELAFAEPEHEKLFMARAKTLLERWRERTGEAGWDAIDDRIDDAEGALEELSNTQRKKLLTQAAREADEFEIVPEALPSDRAEPNVVDGMVHVPAGPFLSGPQKTSRDTKAFWIDQFPVTNAEYQRFVEATGYRPPKFWSEGRLKDPDAPVVGVSWYDAFKYAAFAGKSLPTKDQWEKAARGRSGRVFPWGDEFEPSRACCERPDGTDGVEPVTAHPDGRSEWGALDLAGNVWEWTDSPDPQDPEQRIICGGSWVDPPVFLRCDEHLAAYPKDKYDNIGFRCVRLAKE